MNTQKRHDAKTASFLPARGQVKLASFTVIELLVVIAIIAILAAILLPALQNARDRAKTTNCSSNQKQVGQIFSLYTNDFGSYFVNHDTTSVNRGSLYNMHSKGWAWGNLYSLLYAKSAPATSRTFACTAPANFDVIDNAKETIWSYTYGAPYSELGDTDYSPNQRFAFNLRHSAIQKTGFSKVFVIGCAGKSTAGGNPFFKILVGSTSTSYGHIAVWHNNKTNLLFLDGHSANLTAAEIADGAARALSWKTGIAESSYFQFMLGKFGATYRKRLKVRW